MNTSQLFRKESNPFAAAVGSSALLMLTSIAGAIAIGVPAGIAYGWSSNRALKAVAWSVSTLAASLPAFFWAVAIELLNEPGSTHVGNGRPRSALTLALGFEDNAVAVAWQLDRITTELSGRVEAVTAAADCLPIWTALRDFPAAAIGPVGT